MKEFFPAIIGLGRVRKDLDNQVRIKENVIFIIGEALLPARDHDIVRGTLGPLLLNFTAGFQHPMYGQADPVLRALRCHPGFENMRIGEA